VDHKEAEDDGFQHVVGDVEDVLCSDHWDLFICHPPCTALSVSGNHVYAEGGIRHHEREEAMWWTEGLWHLAQRHADSVAFENPVGVLGHTSLGKATQYIQPYEFGEDASKKTGLWLWNLPNITPTERVQGRVVDGKERWSNQTDSGQNKLGPSEQRATERSRTYPGIAEAIVDQWGSYVTNNSERKEGGTSVHRGA
jgi:hypothetical protein